MHLLIIAEDALQSHILQECTREAFFASPVLEAEGNFHGTRTASYTPTPCLPPLVLPACCVLHRMPHRHWNGAVPIYHRKRGCGGGERICWSLKNKHRETREFTISGTMAKLINDDWSVLQHIIMFYTTQRVAGAGHKGGAK